ncbi:MAG: glycerol-3-phosphate 1-O-acyltransferase PlsY [Candidatus Limnocylindria bacterium]
MVPAIVIGYLLGSIPSGVLVGRLAGRADLREHGSRRTGTTNALRVLGPGWAALVLVLDAAKGAAAVLLAQWLAQWLADGDPWIGAAAGVAAIVGHTWSIFIRFAGGRGVATAGGALAALSPVSVILLLPIVSVVIWRTRYVSLASIAAAAAAPIITSGLVLVGWAPAAAVALALAAAVLITIRHADNISRLRAGTERRLGQRGPTVES